MSDCDQCDKLKDAYTKVLQDNVYLCEKSIIKSNILLNTVENLSEATAEEVNLELQKLFERMTANLNDFREQFNSAAKTYKFNRKNGSLISSPSVRTKKRHLMSLKKTGDTQETDVESGGEFKTSPIKLNTYITISDSKSDISEVENKTDLIDENEGEIESDDSQTIPYSTFDVCTNGLKEEGEDDKEQLDKALNLFISQDAQAAGLKEDAEIESSSFDFDDEDIQTKSEHKEIDEQDFRKEAQKNNHELLELLNKTTDGNPNYPDYVTTEQEGDEALQQLEDDASLSSNYSDSDDSNKWSLNESDASDIDVGDLDEEDEPEVQLKSSSISLARVDELDDAAIDRLCDLHSLNKRKCKKELKPKKRRLKRVRLLSSSSSESSESFSATTSSEGSTTPDNLVELEKMPSVCDNTCVPEDVTALADELYDKMTNSDEEPQVSSESSETDAEGKPAKEKKIKQKTNDEDKENQSGENVNEETDSEGEDTHKKKESL